MDLLDTYMKNCTDKSIGPYGGTLFLQYDDPWNPPGNCSLVCEGKINLVIPHN